MRDMPTYETGRWRQGTLGAAVRAAHAATNGGTASQIAKMIGSRPGNVRVTLRRLDLAFAKGRDVPVIWTDDMLAALMRCAQENLSVKQTAERVGVSEVALVRGAFELIRRAVTTC